MTHRGAFYEAPRRILAVDNDLESMRIRRKFLLRVARDKREYERSVVPTAELLQKLKERGIDLFSFAERKWCPRIQNPEESWVRSDENIALLKLSSYDEWWKEIGKKTRNMIRKAEKSGVKASVAEPNEKLAEGIWKIYNETPIRQERASQKYGTTLQQVTTSLRSLPNRTYVGAYFRHELAGFMELIHGDNLMIISQILSLKKHWDKAANNVLIAKLVEVCLNDGVHWVMYGRMGDFSSLSLDNFKQNNGFRRFQLTRYHIPITKKGELAIKLRLHKEMSDILPQSTRYHLAPIYYWFSRNRMRLVVYSKQARTNNK